MSIFYNIMLGYFFGFALGVGCALAVFYAIYSGGYRKAVEHSLLQDKPKRYQQEMAAAKRRAEKAKGESPDLGNAKCSLSPSQGTLSAARLIPGSGPG